MGGRRIRIGSFLASPLAFETSTVEPIDLSLV